MMSLFYYFILNLVSFIFMLVLILIGVAFFTLMERKVLGYIQFRKGPNKVGMIGLFQPFSDAIKLLTNEIFLIFQSSYVFFFFCPSLMLILSLILWGLMPFMFNCYSFNYGILFMFCILSLNSYILMLVGWSSNSNYAMLGCLRSIAQSISYEVCFLLFIFCMVIMVESFSFYDFLIYQMNFKFIISFFPLFLIFYISMLAELNRTPFDLVEGESELVSGFNVEYSSSGFTMIFLAEYSNIMFMSMVSVILFLGIDMGSLIFYLFFIFISFSVIWIRGVMPRIRYDQLMYLCWKKFLPFSLIYLVYSFWLKIIFINLLM